MSPVLRTAIPTHPAELEAEISAFRLQPPLPLLGAAVLLLLEPPPSKTGKNLQEVEQVSEFLLFPSSHSSPTSTIPFPQTGLAVGGVMFPEALGPSIVQVEEQPSPLILLPSSQASTPTWR
jgi:hypothetical protein